MLNKLPTAACTQMNPRGGKPTPMGGHQIELSPREHWELDLTEVTLDKSGYQYLIVFVDTFSKWVGAFLTELFTELLVSRFVITKGRGSFQVPLWKMLLLC